MPPTTTTTTTTNNTSPGEKRTTAPVDFDPSVEDPSLSETAAPNWAEVEILIRHFESSDVQEKASALSEIARLSKGGHGNLFLNADVVKVLREVLIVPPSEQCLPDATHILECFSGRYEPSAFEVVKPLLLMLPKLLGSKDEGVVASACRAAFYLSTAPPKDQMKEIFDSELLLDLLVGLFDPFSGEKRTVALTSLLAIGNVIARSHQMTFKVTRDTTAVRALLSFLQPGFNSRRKIACWILSNIFANDFNQIKVVLSEAKDTFGELVELVSSSDVVLRSEAIYALSNVIIRGTDEQLHYLETNFNVVSALAISSGTPVPEAGFTKDDAEAIAIKTTTALTPESDPIVEEDVTSKADALNSWNYQLVAFLVLFALVLILRRVFLLLGL